MAYPEPGYSLIRLSKMCPWNGRTIQCLFYLGLSKNSSTPLFASWSANSFPGCPLWPLTQCQEIWWSGRRVSNSCHKSAFLTGSLLAVFQPRFFHPSSHSVTPFWTYWESVQSSTELLCFRARRAKMTALISMRLLVVSFAPPWMCFSWPPERNTAPHPPGPGLPLQAPSV